MDWLDIMASIMIFVIIVALLVAIGFVAWHKRADIRNLYAQMMGALRTAGLPALVAIVTAAWIVATGLLLITAPLTTAVIIGLGVGLFAFLFVMPYIPNTVASLSNDPNRFRKAYTAGMDPQTITTRDYPKSTFGFFTKVFPGQDKVIERGGRNVRCIMAFAHHRFKGETLTNDLTPKHTEYWEVEDTPAGEKDSHPIPFPPLKKSWWWILYSPLSLLWWAWKMHVYNITGHVFTGIPPFQGPRVYPMERFKRVTQPNGKVELQRVEDYSDHYRVAHFQYPLKIADVDTRDKQPVVVLLNIIGRVFNPYKVAYNTDDDWPTRFTGSISNRITWFARQRPLEQVWVAQDESGARALSESVMQVGTYPVPADVSPQGSTCAFGIVTEDVQVLDISPMDPDVEKRLGDEAIAKVDRDARKIRAEGDAEYIRLTAAALSEHPEGAVIIQADAMVRAAQAASASGNVVLLGTTQADPMQAALLQGIRRVGNRQGT